MLHRKRDIDKRLIRCALLDRKRDGTVLIFGLPPNTTDGDRAGSHNDMVIR